MDALPSSFDGGQVRKIPEAAPLLSQEKVSNRSILSAKVNDLVQIFHSFIRETPKMTYEQQTFLGGVVQKAATSLLKLNQDIKSIQGKLKEINKTLRFSFDPQLKTKRNVLIRQFNAHMANWEEKRVPQNRALLATSKGKRAAKFKGTALTSLNSENQKTTRLIQGFRTKSLFY